MQRQLINAGPRDTPSRNRPCERDHHPKMRSPTCSSMPLLGLGAIAFGTPWAVLIGDPAPGFRNAAAEGARRIGVPTVGVDEPKPGSSTFMRDDVDGKMLAEVAEDMMTSLEGAEGMGGEVDMPKSGRAMLEPSRASACAGSCRGYQHPYR